MQGFRVGVWRFKLFKKFVLIKIAITENSRLAYKKINQGEANTSALIIDILFS